MRISGNPNTPTLSYLYRKTIKYLFLAPTTQLLRFTRFLIPGSKILRDNHLIVFVGGMHRSGTSLLYKLIQSQPDISGISNTTVPEDEGQFLQSIYEPDSKYGITFAFKDEAILDETSPLITDENKAALINDWGGYWDMKKNILLEKTPSNLIRMRFLNSLFQHTYFITIIRHPIATCLAVSKWTDEDITTLLEHWFYAHSIFFNAHNSLINSSWLRYEDFVSNPDKELKKIFTQLNVPPIGHGSVKIRESNCKYFKKWENIKISDDEIRRIQEKNSKRLKQLQYSLYPPYVLNVKD